MRGSFRPDWPVRSFCVSYLQGLASNNTAPAMPCRPPAQNPLLAIHRRRGRDLRYTVFSHDSLLAGSFRLGVAKSSHLLATLFLFVFSPIREHLVQSGQDKLLDSFPFLCRQNFQILMVRLAQPERGLLLFFFWHFTSLLADWYQDIFIPSKKIVTEVENREEKS